MNRPMEECQNQILKLMGIDPIYVQLAQVVLAEAQGTCWERTRISVWWLVSAGLSGAQAIRATNHAQWILQQEGMW